MKRLLTLLVSVFAVMTLSAAQVDSTSTVAGIGTEQIYNDGKDFFKSITTTAGDVAVTGYDIIVQQQRVYAVQYLLVGLVCLIFIYMFVKYYKRNSDKQANSLFPAIVFGGLAIWTGIVFSMHYSQIIQGIVNPDFAAINDIINMFKQVKGN